MANIYGSPETDEDLEPSLLDNPAPPPYELDPMPDIASKKQQYDVPMSPAAANGDPVSMNPVLVNYLQQVKAKRDGLSQKEAESKQRRDAADMAEMLTKATGQLGNVNGRVSGQGLVGLGKSTAAEEEADLARQEKGVQRDEGALQNMYKTLLAKHSNDARAQSILAKQQADEAYRRDRDAKNDKFKQQQLDLMAAKAAKGEGKDDAKAIPAHEATQISDGVTALKLLDNYEKKIEENKDIMGPIEGRLRTLNPWDEKASKFDSDSRIVRQAIGKYLEGGVLRAEDEIKYKNMLPKMEDKPSVAKYKLQEVKKLLANKLESQKSLLGAQGYKQGGIDAPQSSVPIPQAATAGGLRMMNPKTGKVGTVAPDKIEAAKAAGYTEVPNG